MAEDGMGGSFGGDAKETQYITKTFQEPCNEDELRDYIKELTKNINIHKLDRIYYQLHSEVKELMR